MSRYDWLGREVSWNLQCVLAGKSKKSSTTRKDGEPTELQK